MDNVRAKHRPSNPSPTAIYFEAAECFLDKLRRMIARYDNVPRQRTEGWYATKSKSIGGSELATLLGINPYSSRTKMLARKAGLDGGFTGGIACWWGTMFESVSEELVAMTFSSPVIGTDIHIRSETLPAHANSPDGYTIIAFAATDEGWDLCLNPEAAIESGQVVVPVPSLVELKAPYSRLLKGEVPKYYVPQLKSGMALSPAAYTGLYVEVVYRLCSLDQLVPCNGEYSLGYHKKDSRTIAKKGPIWKSPVALGLSAVFAPRMGTRRQRHANTGVGEKGGDQIALELLSFACGGSLGSTDDLIDFGEIAENSPSTFDSMMRFVDNGEFQVHHSKPHICEDGEDVSACLRQFMHNKETTPVPEHHFLLGYIPWKVMQADYHVVSKNYDFIEEIREPVESFMADLERLTNAEDVQTAYTQMVSGSAPTAAQRMAKAGYSQNDIVALAALHMAGSQ